MCGVAVVSAERTAAYALIIPPVLLRILNGTLSSFEPGFIFGAMLFGLNADSSIIFSAINNNTKKKMESNYLENPENPLIERGRLRPMLCGMYSVCA